MLEEQINGFIEYCKVSGFRDKSIESLSIRLNQFNNFLKTARLRKIKSITYRYLSRLTWCQNLVSMNLVSKLELGVKA